MSSLPAFFRALMIVFTMAHSTLQTSRTYVQREEPAYHFFYNVNEPNSDYQTHTQHRNYDFLPKGPETIFATSQETLNPDSSYSEAAHPGYPRWGRPMGPQFSPAPGVLQTLPKLIPGYEKEKLPPGYVAPVAKIDTPKGYKLLDKMT